MTVRKINLLDLSFPELQQLIVDWSEPRFRAQQIWRWVYHTLTDDIDEMANLPQELRRRLADETFVGRLKVANSQVASDGLTEKALLQAADGELFEAVLMRYTSRNTLCVSSQIGCPLGCIFCATGMSGWVRDLSAGEISGQVIHFSRQLRQENAHVTNVVFMGMGEPMLNYDAVHRAIANLNDREGLALGLRRFTVSTAGVVPGIERMAREGQAVGLAISLHAPDDALRSQIVPANKRYPIDRLMQSARFYVQRTGRRVTFEYALAKGLNDTVEHAKKTAELLKGLLCHVNLIPLNPTPGCAYEPSTRERVLAFQQVLVEGRIQTTVRVRRGSDIDAACGQLRVSHLSQSGQVPADASKARV